MQKISISVGCLLISLAHSAPAQACATCGCSLDTEAVTGFSARPGLSLGIEYDAIDQNQYRHQSQATTPAQVVDAPAVSGASAAEIERQTRNRYLTLSLNERFNSRWSLTLQLPWIERQHSTYGQQNAPYQNSETAASQLSSASVDALGDMKILATYQGGIASHNLGLEGGLKLPTGAYGGSNSAGHSVGHPINFSTGPASGTPLDASLQAGTGSTDLLAGAFYLQSLSQNIDGFINGLLQAALWHRLDESGASYRPGNQFNLSAGIKVVSRRDWSPQLQLNFTDRQRDQGALADTADTAGRVLYLSPGLSYSHGRSYLYGFVQWPLYSVLAGYQLFPRWTASLGLSQRF